MPLCCSAVIVHFTARGCRWALPFPALLCQLSSPPMVLPAPLSLEGVSRVPPCNNAASQSPRDGKALSLGMSRSPRTGQAQVPAAWAAGGVVLLSPHSPPLPQLSVVGWDREGDFVGSGERHGLVLPCQQGVLEGASEGTCDTEVNGACEGTSASSRLSSTLSGAYSS